MKWISERNWLNIAEYVSLSSSFAGLVVALTSQQLVYAAAPLTLAMSLNFANRQRFQQQVRQQKATISKVCQETQLLNSKVLSLPSANQVNVLEVSINHLEQAIVDIDTKQQLNSLMEAFNNRPELKEIDELKEAIFLLHGRVVNLPSPTPPFEPSYLMVQLANLTERLDNLPLATLQHQIVEVQELVENLDISSADLHDRTRNLNQLEQNFQTVQEMTYILDKRTTSLESRIDSFESIQQHLDNLQQLTVGYIKADDFERLKAKLSQELTSQVETRLEQRIAEINCLFKEIQPKYEYKLICDRDQSQQVFLESLLQTQSRLILVCPWLTDYVINADIIQKFKAILNKNSRIDIGWGHLSDIKPDHLKQMTRQEFLRLVRHKAYKSPSDNLWNYSLNKLERLEQEHPQLFQLKLLGTHEKFLVCDSEWAMLGSHNFLTSTDRSLEREVGLWTNDPYIVNKLIKRFDEAKNLEDQQVHLAVAS